ncbi:MAG: IS200/IS605 family transposase [Sporomusaceae bacterium]|jgi:putative transposase|nr:IS200/IS605 family transposase [Sporomusaceae bacterium]
MNIIPIRHSHSVCKLIYHFVVVCTRRRKELTEVVTIDLFKKAIEKYPITILEGEIGERDHVHLLIQSDATMSPAQIARVIKGCSQNMIRKILPEWSGWSRSYYISTVGGNSLAMVEQYIKNQDKD